MKKGQGTQIGKKKNSTWSRIKSAAIPAAYALGTAAVAYALSNASNSGNPTGTTSSWGEGEEEQSRIGGFQVDNSWF
jgi:hypothetical protein